MQAINSYASLFLIFLVIKFLFKNLRNEFHKDHQKLAGKKSVPLIGGIIMFIFYALQTIELDTFFLLFSLLILILGILSDNNLINSPKIRLLTQLLIILSYVYFSEIYILDLKNDFLNTLLENRLFNLFFVTSCFLVLINGSNFIDGLDGLNLGYFILVILIIFYIKKTYDIEINQNLLIIIFYSLSFLLLLNLLNFLYLGDSGAYLIAFILGSFLIHTHNDNLYLSPYLIALLLWYPAFENLFSIIRKKLFKKNPLHPDNGHFHQLLFKLIKKNKKIFISKYSNIISSLIILFYNFIIFFIALKFISQSKILILILLINIFLYITVYNYLKKFN